MTPPEPATVEKKPPVKRNAPLISALTIVVTFAVFFCLRWLIRPRSIASMTAPDGTEFCIVQKFTWSADLFTTSVYYRKPGWPWGWLDYDRRDSYWKRGELGLDAAKHLITVTRDGRTTATFDYVSDVFTLMKSDTYVRTVNGAQTWMPPEFKPPR